MTESTVDVTNHLYYGENQIIDPRDNEYAWPWTLKIVEHVDEGRLVMKLAGIPYLAPVVGETFYAYLVFQGLQTQGQPQADILKIGWEVRNGPSVFVTVEDMYNPAEVSLDGLTTDGITYHWHARTPWENECV